MKFRAHSFIQAFSVVLVVFAISACSSNIVLFKNLSQQDGNDIYAALLASGIPVEKNIEKEGVSISVPESMSNNALEILKAKGLPKDKTTSIGEVFKKDSMISSPLEERARYLYALSQELESTLMQMDGVLAARVHIVLPDQTTPGEPVTPSSAAVFVKYAAKSSFPAYIPKIRELIFNSIPGISGDPQTSITVAAIPSETISDAGLSLVWYGPMALRTQDRIYFLSLIYLVAGMWVLSLGIVWLKATDQPDWPAWIRNIKGKLSK